MDNFNLKKYLKEGKLNENAKQLNENAPGFDTRKSGEPLPTLESVKKAYEAKKLKEGKISKENSDKLIDIFFNVLTDEELDQTLVSLRSWGHDLITKQGERLFTSMNTVTQWILSIDDDLATDIIYAIENGLSLPRKTGFLNENINLEVTEEDHSDIRGSILTLSNGTTVDVDLIELMDNLVDNLDIEAQDLWYDFRKMGLREEIGARHKQLKDNIKSATGNE